MGGSRGNAPARLAAASLEWLWCVVAAPSARLAQPPWGANQRGGSELIEGEARLFLLGDRSFILDLLNLPCLSVIAVGWARFSCCLSIDFYPTVDRKADEQQHQANAFPVPIRHRERSPWVNHSGKDNLTRILNLSNKL